MDKKTLNSWLKKEDTNAVQRKMLIQLWDTLLAWGAYEGYYTKKEISYHLGINRNTLDSRIKKFKEHFPEAYDRILEHRNSVKKSTNRLGRSLGSPTSYNNSMDKFIVEKY
jgi:hypothetical protein